VNYRVFFSGKAPRTFRKQWARVPVNRKVLAKLLVAAFALGTLGERFTFCRARLVVLRKFHHRLAAEGSTDFASSYALATLIQGI
jgi:hypothetical protein